MLETFGQFDYVLTPLALLLVMGAIIFVTILVLLRRKSAAAQDDSAQIIARFMETAALFQAMRDLVQDQKKLAKTFNQAVEKKVAIIREVAQLVADEHESLLKMNDGLSQRLAEAQQDIEQLEKRLGMAGEKPAPPEKPARAIDHVVVSPNLSALRAIAKPAVGADSDELIDTWVGLDFSGSDADSGSRPDTALESLPTVGVERHEFRSLLNMGVEDPLESGPASAGASPFTDIGASVRARAYKYHDAGMSVAQIAHEIGIGKGEVKLILSLRDQSK